MLPADDRHAVAVVLILRCIELFAGQCAGIVFGPLVAFFQHDIAFSRDVVCSDGQIGHPVAFHLHHQIKPISSDALEICSVIVAGKGVVAAAVRGNGR